MLEMKHFTHHTVSKEWPSMVLLLQSWSSAYSSVRLIFNSQGRVWGELEGCWYSHTLWAWQSSRGFIPKVVKDRHLLREDSFQQKVSQLSKFGSFHDCVCMYCLSETCLTEAPLVSVFPVVVRRWKSDCENLGALLHAQQCITKTKYRFTLNWSERDPWFTMYVNWKVLFKIFHVFFFWWVSLFLIFISYCLFED